MRNNRLVVLLGLLAVVLTAAAALWAGPAIRETVERVMEGLRAAGPAVFFIAMALLPLAGFPLAPFTLAAGPVFAGEMGVWGVIACAVASVSVNVALAYWIAARALRPAIIRVVERFGWRLPEAPERTALELTLLVRVIPGPPFFAQSYLLGLARVPWRIYLAVSTGVPAAYIAATVLAGDALQRGDEVGLGRAGILFAVACAGMHYLRKRLTRRRTEAGTAAGRE